MTSSLPTSRVPDPAGAPALRWGVLAPGRIAAKTVDAVARHTRQRVVACGSRSLERAQQFAHEHGIERPYGSYAELLADPDVDAVYVASPHSHHAELALQVIDAGKHVLVEKAFTRNAAEARQVVEAARSAGVTCMEAMWTRFLPRTDIVSQLLADGALGDVTTFLADHGQYMASHPASRLFDPALAGGALLDLGVYCVHPLVDLFGEPQTVTRAEVTLSTGADGAAVLLATYPGLVADLSASKITASSLPSQIQGEAATMLIDHIALPRRIVIEPIGGSPREILVEGPPNNLGYEIEFFVQCVRDGRAPREATQRSLAAARVIDRARAE